MNLLSNLSERFSFVLVGLFQHAIDIYLHANVAHPIFIGLHGSPGQSEPQVDYQGSLAINCGDGNYVKDVMFDNIRIELPDQVAKHASIVQVKVGWNQNFLFSFAQQSVSITVSNPTAAQRQELIAIEASQLLSN